VATGAAGPAAAVQLAAEVAAGEAGEGVAVLPGQFQHQGRGLQRELRYSELLIVNIIEINAWISPFPLFLERDDRPPDLHSLLDPADLQLEGLLLDQGPEFRLIVEDIVVVAYLVDAGVVPTHRDVRDADLALVPPPYFDAVLRDVLDHHHVIGLLRNALQHQVLPRRLLDREQLVLDAVLFDETRVLLLADLAVKLFEVVLDGAAHHFLLDLALVPFLEAVEVHHAAGAAALAGLAEELANVGALGQHAVLALEAFGGADVVLNHDLLVVHPELGLGLCACPDAGVVDGGDQVLDSAQLDDLSDGCVM
jgi:hypothetical protein